MTVTREPSHRGSRSPANRSAARSQNGWPGCPRSSPHCVATTPAAERDRVLQYEAVESIRRTGVLGLRVPTEFGGPGGKARDVLSAVIQIGRGSSNVAQALRSHFGFAERLLSNRATQAERDVVVPARLCRDSSSATPSPTPRAGPRRARTPRCFPTPRAYCGSTATSSTRPARCSPMSSRCRRSTPTGRDVQAIIPADRRRCRIVR